MPIAQQMPADGLLYLGGAETVLGITSRFAPLPAERGVYGIAGPGQRLGGLNAQRHREHRESRDPYRMTSP